MTQRVNRYLAERVAEGDHGAQGAEVAEAADNGRQDSPGDVPPPVANELPMLRPMSVAPKPVEARETHDHAEAEHEQIEEADQDDRQADRGAHVEGAHLITFL